jgi:hypothetical protein
LIHSNNVEPGKAFSTMISAYLYTDMGLVPMKDPLRRDEQPPESCQIPPV